MRQRSFVALIAWLLAAVAWADAPAADPGLRHVGTFTWRDPDPAFGGLSGLELFADGARLIAVSDRGTVWRATLRRRAGAVVGVDAVSHDRLTTETGAPLPARAADAEGAALGPDGTLYVSFEGVHRVIAYPNGRKPRILPGHKDFARMLGNSSLEALCIDPTGRLVTIPERSGRLTRPFPVYRFGKGHWTTPFSIPRTEGFLVVGCDYDAKGRLFLLERAFTGLGFHSQIRMVEAGAEGKASPKILLKTASNAFDNLEGIAAWTDRDGSTRLTLISDDNFRWFQRTQIVDFVVTE